MPIGNNYLINNDSTNEDQQSPAVISNENQFAVAWQDKRDLTWNYDIYFQRYLLTGQKLGDSEKLNDDYNPDDGQSYPDISGDSLGNIV